VRVAIVGAGIAGVTTAYELARAGHDVTVLERRAAVAAEASYADAGVLAPGLVSPWAAPGMPRKLLGRVVGRHAPVRLGRGAVSHLSWLWRWWRACQPAACTRQRAALHGLASLSRERLAAITAMHGLEFEHAKGLLVLLRGARDLEAVSAGLAFLESRGASLEVVDAGRARLIEPGLRPETPLHAAIHLPLDGAGNCRQFAHLLKREAERLGANFLFEREVRSILPGGTVQLEIARRGDAASGHENVFETGIFDAVGPDAFDTVVVCAGTASGPLLQAAGIRVPLVPVQGHSLTAPLRQPEAQLHSGPLAAVMDERHRVTITRLGQRVRVAGSVEFGGRDGAIAGRAMRRLYRVLEDWFPGSAQVSQAQHWKGARPMLPDSSPVLGASGAPGVWLNIGHGWGGWSLACGSAAVLADLMNRRAAPIDLSGLSVDRLR
jgi:D-amino-acid dehydrogenase